MLPGRTTLAIFLNNFFKHELHIQFPGYCCLKSIRLYSNTYIMLNVECMTTIKAGAHKMDGNSE